MNISKQNVDALNALLTIELDKDDVQPKLDKAIKDYAKKVAVKGFRPGHTPVGMIKKMYGKSLLAEELDKIVGESLTNYIRDNKIEILGAPMANKDQEPINLDQEFEKATFKFDLGLAPEIKVNLDAIEIEKLKIQISDADLDENIKAACSRFSNREATDVVDEESHIKGNISVAGELKKENGIISVSTIADDQKALFIGKKVGEKVSFDVHKALKEESEISYLLGLNAEETAKLDKNVTAELEIVEAYQFKDAEIGKELFDKMFPGKDVKDEAEFRAKVKENLEIGNAYGESWQVSSAIRKALEAQVGKVDLPEEFLKRWLIDVNKNNEKATPEVIDEEFPRFLEDLRWRVIKNNIIRNGEIKIEQADIVEEAKRSAKAQFLQYGITEIPEEQLNNYALSMVRNEQQSEQIFESAAESKVDEYVLSKAKVSERVVSRQEFNNIMEQSTKA